MREKLWSGQTYPFSEDVMDIGMHFGHLAVPRGFQSVLPVFSQTEKLSYSDQRATGVCDGGVRTGLN